ILPRSPFSPAILIASRPYEPVVKTFELSMCPKLCPPRLEIASRTRSSDGCMYLIATDSDAQPMILQSVHASTCGAIRVANECLKLYSKKGRTPDSFKVRACCFFSVE